MPASKQGRDPIGVILFRNKWGIYTLQRVRDKHWKEQF